MKRAERAHEILRRLRSAYPKKGEFVHWTTPLELVIGTVLSAQCTDKRVNIVTKDLFQKYPTAAAYANATLEELQQDIGSITFYKSKSKYLQNIGRILTEEHGGEVPGDVDALMALPGVAKKTATLIMAKAFNTYTGVAVDTHVKRLAPRLGLTKETKNTDRISRDLEALFEPSVDYLDINEYLIVHGRAVCAPRTPKCGDCLLNDICPYGKKVVQQEGKNTQ